MTAFVRRATSDLLMWLGLDSATVRGFGLGRPGSEWQTWSLFARLAPAVARVAPAASAPLAPAARACNR